MNKLKRKRLEFIAKQASTIESLTKRNNYLEAIQHRLRNDMDLIAMLAKRRAIPDHNGDTWMLQVVVSESLLFHLRGGTDQMIEMVGHTLSKQLFGLMEQQKQSKLAGKVVDG